MKRTNIMLTDDQHKILKVYSKRKGRTLGELVREALDTAYKKKNIIEHRRQIAMEAYKEGFISIGKLSEIFGIDMVSLRLYLKEEGIQPQTQDIEEIAEDVVNA
ncbi:MAG: UPF0175 family protein [Nitrospirota bacterium]